MLLKSAVIRYGYGYGTCYAFSKTRLMLELQRVLSCKPPAVFLHFPLEEKEP